MTAEPILLRPIEAARLLSISRSRVYELLGRGEIPGAVRIGGSVRIHAPTLRAWLDEIAGQQTAAADVQRPATAKDRAAQRPPSGRSPGQGLIPMNMMMTELAITGPADLRDQHWLDERITAIDDGIEAVLDIARNWTDGRNLARLHPGIAPAIYIQERVAHAIGRGIIGPLLAESNWSNRQIADVAGLSEITVRRTATFVAVDRPAETLGADGKQRPARVVKVITAQVIEADPLGPEIESIRLAAEARVRIRNENERKRQGAIRQLFQDAIEKRLDGNRVDTLWTLIEGFFDRDHSDPYEAAERIMTTWAGLDAILNPPAATDDPMAYRCSACSQEYTEEEAADQDQGPLYECSRCGNQFNQDGSADGSSNRCSDCNIFAAKIAELACPECGEGELEPIDDHRDPEASA